MQLDGGGFKPKNLLDRSEKLLPTELPVRQQPKLLYLTFYQIGSLNCFKLKEKYRRKELFSKLFKN